MAEQGAFVMSAPSTPRAARIQRPSWRDSRVIIGIAVVLAAVALGAYLMDRADDRIPMYSAASTLIPGQALTDTAVVRVDVQLGADTARYLSAREPVPTDRVLLREVRVGELVPWSAIGTVEEAALSQVTIAVDATSAASLMTGTVVDVFVNERVADGRAGEFVGPEVLLTAVTVAGVDGSGRGLGSSGRDAAIRLMVPTEQVPDLIAAVDHEAKVTVVPVPGALTRSSG